MSSLIAPRPVTWHAYVPKLVTVLRRGYTSRDLRADLLAGLTVSIVALPLPPAPRRRRACTPRTSPRQCNSQQRRDTIGLTE
jgi:hypothetical protein